MPSINQASAYAEVAGALAHLDSLVDFVYSGITNKIMQEKSRLANLSSRIEVAQVKTQRLIGCREALTVFSPAKYLKKKLMTRLLYL